MALTRSAINLIGRTHPEIFDILGNPGLRVGRDALDLVALNPQPLPPLLTAGVRAGHELVGLAFTADRLRIGFEIDIDDWCGTPPKRPPFVWPPQPWPPRGTDPRAVEGPQPEPWVSYHLGLAASLELTAHLWEGLAGADGLARVAETALATADKIVG